MKNIIRTDMLSRLNNAMIDMVEDMKDKMEMLPGMTGNTKTSPAGATYDNQGVLIDIDVVGSTDATRAPIRTKLKKGERFKAGLIRYDGSEQSNTFKADADTSGDTSQNDNIRLLNSMQGSKDFRMVIAGGSEYLGQTQVTDNFAYCQNNVDKFFK